MYQIKRWYKMLSGKSVWHVNQDIGKHFSKDDILGYYNNMKEKVTMMPELLDNDNLPSLELENGQSVYFPVTIFQYGLGAYDLYIETKDNKYKRKFLQCANWALDNQDNYGRWNNFFYIFPDTPYSAMAQGEAVSLLIRAYKESGVDKYFIAAQKGIKFMISPMEEGGVSEYMGNNIIFREYTNQQTVLNGWIFAWFGLYDYVLCTSDKEYKKILENSLNAIINYLPRFRCSYWSIYSLDGKIASPFYHNLHIALMQALYQLTDEKIFESYAEKWRMQQNNPFYKGLAFTKKAIQKILEK